MCMGNGDEKIKFLWQDRNEIETAKDKLALPIHIAWMCKTKSARVEK